MCGLAGALIGNKPGRNTAEMKRIGELFTRILVRSERRGPYATGIALVNSDGDHRVFKAPVTAREFVATEEYRRVLGMLDARTTLLMGHTRWPTRGSHLDNANNHPLVSECGIGTSSSGRSRTGACILAHNGHIENYGLLFRVLGLHRETEVDSEILLRIAEMNLTKSGIDLDGLAEDLSLCRGRMSFVVVATSDPTKIILVKGNQPLEFRYSKRREVLLYASETEYLDEAVSREDGWVEWQVPSMCLLEVHTGDLVAPSAKPFHFDGLLPGRRQSQS